MDPKPGYYAVQHIAPGNAFFSISLDASVLESTMFHSALQCTLATSTVFNDVDVVDVAAVFGSEVSDAIAEAASNGYRALDEMCDEMHSVQKVRLHLAEARWELAQRENEAILEIESLDFPLTYQPRKLKHAIRRTHNN